MNELLFFIQIIILTGCALGALRFGKEALVAWVSIQALIANVFVLKQISLFGLNVTASDAFAVGSILGLNLLQERFGQKEARQASWICFFFMLFFAVVSQLHLLYTPNIYDTAHSAFVTLLSPAPRLFLASLSVFFLVQQIDIRLFLLLQQWLPNRSFALRSGISLMISQFLDTLLFSFAGLYGIVESIMEIIILSFLVKVIVVIFSTTLVKAAKT